MKTDLIFRVFWIAAIYVIALDVVAAIIYAVGAARFLSGGDFTQGFLAVAIVLIALNGLLIVFAAGYFALRQFWRRKDSTGTDSNS